MRLIGSSVLVALSATAAAAQSYGTVESKRKVEVVGSGLHVEEDCKGRKADLDGSNLVVKLSGICGGVKVVGRNNRISATIADGAPINVYGSNNDGEWTSPGQVEVEIVGPDNRVRQVGN